MTNSYYNGGSIPAPNAPGASLAIRNEFSLLAQAFNKMPELSGLTAGQLVRVNVAGTELETTGTLNGYTFTNVTITSGAITGVSLSGLTSPLPIASGGTGSTSTQFVSLTTNVSGVLPITNGGTNAATAPAARANILPAYAGNASKALAVNALGTDVEFVALPGTGTVTSVGGTGAVNGITLTGTVTAAGDLTLGGTLSGVDLTSQITGTLPVANGGTGLTAPGTSGNVLTSNGTAWVSATISSFSAPQAYFFSAF
jgi:hypothetical protein